MAGNLHKRGGDIPDGLIAELKAHVAARQVSRGVALLDANARVFASLDPSQHNSAPLLNYLAQWVDIGYRDLDFLNDLLQRFRGAGRARLSLADYLHLRMAEGLLALLHDDADQALQHFAFVLGLEAEVPEKEIIAIARFWTARCHRKKGEYDEALKFAAAGRELALQLGHTRMAAVMRVLESWLMFQKGYRREATALLEEAARVLRETDDDITLGNIYSAQGRMVRRRGSYNEALKFFSRAIEHYQQRNPQHRNLARTLVNIAYAQRLIALEMARQMDAARTRRSSAPDAAEERRRNRQRWEQLRTEALSSLDRAEKIYRHHSHHHGIGSVAENRGLLYLDIGDLESASQQAAAARAIAQEQNDFILIARTCMLQCSIEQARLEEGIETGSAAGPLEHAHAARDLAREAVEAARHTQNQRLLARTNIGRGLICTHPLVNDPETAKQCCDAATSLLRSVDYDDLGEQLHQLRRKLAPRGSIDPLLRSWSQGITGDKTFQEMTEQFAELVIPRVWEKEERKVSRVAKRLSISPKKVRRILRRAGKLRH